MVPGQSISLAACRRRHVLFNGRAGPPLPRPRCGFLVPAHDPSASRARPIAEFGANATKASAPAASPSAAGTLASSTSTVPTGSAGKHGDDRGDSPPGGRSLARAEHRVRRETGQRQREHRRREIRDGERSRRRVLNSHPGCQQRHCWRTTATSERVCTPESGNHERDGHENGLTGERQRQPDSSGRPPVPELVGRRQSIRRKIRRARRRTTRPRIRLPRPKRNRERRRSRSCWRRTPGQAPR